MIKYFALGLIILFAIDAIFRDGQLIVVFFQQDFFMHSVIRIFLIVIGGLATILLFHSIIWDLNLLNKPEEKKTEYQLKIEKEEEEERLRLEKEKEEEEQKKKKKPKTTR